MSFSILRFDSRPIEAGSSSSSEPPMKFQCDPFLVTLLRSIPVDDASDLCPPEGFVEGGAITYVYLKSDDVNTKCACGEMKHAGLSAPVRVPLLLQDEGKMQDEDEDEPLCPRCVLARSISDARSNPILCYCQFEFVRTTRGCRVEAYLGSVVTSKEHRGQGICKKLLTAAFQDFVTSVPTLQRIRLHTGAEMKHLISMYSSASFGFTVRRMAKKYYRKPVVRDAVEMECCNLARFRVRRRDRQE